MDKWRKQTTFCQLLGAPNQEKAGGTNTAGGTNIIGLPIGPGLRHHEAAPTRLAVQEENGSVPAAAPPDFGSICALAPVSKRETSG